MAEIVSFAPSQVLLVEDNPADAALITAWLADVPDADSFELLHARDMGGAMEMLANGHNFHAALLDLSLPDAAELEGFSRIQHQLPMLPVIILTGRDDEELAMQAVEKGAQDYLVKDKADEATLRRAIRYAIQRKRFEDCVIRQANFDPLTGLANRTLFESRLDMAIARAQRLQHGIGLFLLDLDDFKHVNDTFGHAAGDELLKETGARLTQCLRPYDTAARLGGDEFAVLIEGILQPRDCVTVAQKLIERIVRPVKAGRCEVAVGVSIGISTSAGDRPVPALHMLKQADDAMYRAKQEGKSAYRFYTQDMDEALTLRMHMEKDLSLAVQNDELMLCYQPKQALPGGGLGGVEALVRWRHPQLGLLLPGAFIGIAQETGMLGQVEEWVLRQVCDDMARWRDMEFPALGVSVNVSAVLFDSPGFVPKLAAQLANHDLPPEHLSIELPENIFTHMDHNREQTFTALHRLGVGISMDRFGGDMSSLRAIKQSALSEIKIDSRGTGPEPESRRMLQGIIACAHALGLKVVASGVETEGLRHYLYNQHCDTIQGFVFSRPMPAAYLETWLRENFLAEPETRQSR